MEQPGDGETFEFLFSIADLDSALLRSRRGGWRLKIEGGADSIAQINALFDYAEARGGMVLFGARVAPVPDGSRTESNDGSSKIDKETARGAAHVDLRRARD